MDAYTLGTEIVQRNGKLVAICKVEFNEGAFMGYNLHAITDELQFNEVKNLPAFECEMGLTNIYPFIQEKFKDGIYDFLLMSEVDR